MIHYAVFDQAFAAVSEAFPILFPMVRFPEVGRDRMQFYRRWGYDLSPFLDKVHAFPFGKCRLSDMFDV